MEDERKTTEKRRLQQGQEQLEGEKKALYLLTRVEGMYPGLLRRMYEFAGGFREAYQVPAQEYLKRGLMGRTKQGQPLLLAYDRRRRQEEKMLREYEGFSLEGIRTVSVFDRDYPKRLLPLPDKPLLLYVRGRLPAEDRPAAAIIGARRCSEYGRETAAFFGRSLSEAGVQVISGMASGIDGIAQSAALSAAGESFGVLGSGVKVCYPLEHGGIFRRMAAGNGGLISEFPPDSPALPFHFILRNRIIAGLCDVLLVLEAREKSGTAITVSNALDYGKEVFALPGRINDPLGRGCNALLKEGASLLTSPGDVLEFLGLQRGQERAEAREAERDKMISALANPEKMVYSCLDSEPEHMEKLLARTGLGYSTLSEALIRLELLGLADSPQSGYYRRS